jgi:DNA topoisomerase-3
VTDHYAIIPTGAVPGSLSEKEKAVYDMICRRFLSVFYPGAEYDRIKIEGSAGNEKFYGTAKYLVNPGYFAVAGMPEENENLSSAVDAMKKLEQGKRYPVSFETREGKTEPPKRYTTGSIILAMENAGTLIEDDELREQIQSNGIGTSATRAEVIEKLIRLNYISVNEKKQVIEPTNFGEMVFEIVDMTIPSLLSPEMTAKWEKGLSQIASGEITSQEYLNKLYEYIRSNCEKIKGMDSRDEIMKKIYPLATGKIRTEYKAFDPYNTSIKCPLCGDDVETTRWGFKCRSNVSKTEGCSFVLGGDILGHRLLTNELALLLHDGKSGPYYDFVSKKGKPFGACLVWDSERKQIGFDLVDMPWEETDLSCPVCGMKIVKRDGFYKCKDYIDAETGCSFRVGKILGKAIPDKQVEQLVKEGKTELIKGFKKENGDKFDAFLIWNPEEKRVRFRFPEQADMETKYRCPHCGGKILATAYGFKCEHYRALEGRQEGDCSFYAGTILGHTIKEKELQCIVEKRATDLVTLKNADKKSFEARLYWDDAEQKIALQFDDNTPVETGLHCPICSSPLLKNRYGYKCSQHISRDEGCRFVLGSICGVLIDEMQVKKLVEDGKTDLISGFKPKEKGKRPFSAYLVWKKEENSIAFEFSGEDTSKEESDFTCPSCHQHKLLKSPHSYSCSCGFRLGCVVADKEIPEDQVKKLFIRGETDLISGFFSPRTRKMFSAKLVVNGNKVDFRFPDKKA